jgi:hypothetical protein
MKRLVFAVLLLLVCAVPASAQITNPITVVFDHADFASASRYEGGYFLLPVKADNTCDLLATSGASPVQTDNLGKPATSSGVGMSSNLVSKPIGCYVYKVRALDVSGLYSLWSAPSDPFVRTPVTPSKPVVK